MTSAPINAIYSATMDGGGDQEFQRRIAMLADDVERMWAAGRFVTITSGAIGAGKSTAGKALCAELKRRGRRVEFFPERLPTITSTEYFAALERGDTSLALPFQMAMNAVRQVDITEAVVAVISGRADGAVLERSVFDDRLFMEMSVAAGFISPDMVPVYDATRQFTIAYSTPHVHFVYIDVDFERTFARMESRGHQSEIAAYRKNTAYYQSLYPAYEKWLKTIQEQFPVLMFDNRAEHSELVSSSKTLDFTAPVV